MERGAHKRITVTARSRCSSPYPPRSWTQGSNSALWFTNKMHVSYHWSTQQLHKVSTATITSPLLNSGQCPRSQRDLNPNLSTPNPVFSVHPTSHRAPPRPSRPLQKRRFQVPMGLEKQNVERKPEPRTNSLSDSGMASGFVSILRGEGQ